MINKKIVESWSIWNANGILIEGRLMKSKYLNTEFPGVMIVEVPLCSIEPANSSNRKKTIKLRIKEASMVPLPMIPIAPFEKYFLPNPLIKKPMKGKSGIKRIKFFILTS